MDVLRARLHQSLTLVACLLFGIDCGVVPDSIPERPQPSSSLSAVPMGPRLVRAKLTTNGSPTPAFHTCGLRSDGYVFCWGDDSFGELGTGLPLANTSEPGSVPLAFVVDVAAGFESTCAVDYWGEAWCWGDGRYGELGDGTTQRSALPVQVLNLPPVDAIASAFGVSCALARNRSVWCWGGNPVGETYAAYLGDGTTQQSLVPVAVRALNDVVAIAGVFDHFCALRATGGVSCWGHNESGQLGDGTTLDRLVPVDVLGVHDAVAVTAGWYHSCALHPNGDASCWGDNRYGQLGDGTTTAASIPVSVHGLSPINEIAAGFDDTCAVLVDGTSRCWGRLSPSPPSAPSVQTSLTPPLGDLVSIATGNFFGTTCAVTKTGAAYCWGDNSCGEGGNGATNEGTPIAQPVGIGTF